MDNVDESKQTSQTSVKDSNVVWWFFVGLILLVYVVAKTAASPVSGLVAGLLWISGWIGAAIGMRRGAPGIGFCMSFFAPVIGWIIACFLPKDESNN